MTLNFPNESRSYDSAKNRVRFWGHDGALEISFFVEVDALQKLNPDMSTVEAGILNVFDAARERIYGVADKVYRRNRNGSYAFSLAAADF